MYACNTLQHTLNHTATRCNTPTEQRDVEGTTVAPVKNTLHHTAPHCTTLQHTATHFNTPTEQAQELEGLTAAPVKNTLRHTLHHTLIHCITLQHTHRASARTRRSDSGTHQKHTATHTATHCNTPQHTCNTPTVQAQGLEGMTAALVPKKTPCQQALYVLGGSNGSTAIPEVEVCNSV